MSKITRRIFAVVLAMALLLTSMSGAVTANAANAVVEITLDGTQNFSMASEVLAIINTERAAEGLAPLTADPVLMDYAMQRAAEVYLYYSHTRPDGTSCMTVFGEDYTYGSMGENIAMGQRDAATVMNAWMNSSGHRANILNSSYNSVGIGCFYQSDGSIAWVQLFHSNTSANSDSRTGVTAATGVKVKALSSNLVGHVQHHYFGDDTCAVYLYEGTTVNTDFCLINPMLPWVHPVEITSNNYTYTTSDSAVLSTDNGNRTLIAAGVGVAQLGVQIDGADIYVMDDSGYINPTATVEVMPMPKLTYEIDEQGNIHVDYSGFNSVVTLFYKGINDELWTMGNREADGIYTHYYPDPTETYVYVMRYWDSDLEMYVELGERLVVSVASDRPHTHSYAQTVTAPTCTEDGCIIYTCSCGDTYTETVPALGHAYSSQVTAPTCTDDGYTTHTCASCGHSYTDAPVAATGHHYEVEVTEPTCTEDGEKVYTCSCGHSYTESIPANGHAYSSQVTAPTCTEDGCITYTCRCGHSYTEVLPKIAHSYVGGTCEHCGASESMPGDVNGDCRVNARDVRLLLRYAAGLAGEDEMDMAAADFNGDGRVNARDARALLRSIAGLD